MNIVVDIDGYVPGVIMIRIPIDGLNGKQSESIKFFFVFVFQVKNTH